MLLSRWQKLMSGLGLPESLDTYNSLIESYSQKHRKYHNVSHLKAVLECLDSVEHLTVHKDQIELALWFHDAVYKPFSKSNEHDSAVWASKFLRENNSTKELQEFVHRLVMATAHLSVPENEDEKLIVDIDLSILGRSEDTYKHFQEGVRYEYRKVPSCIYARKRNEVLKGFLDRDRIYLSELLHELFEKQARKNIQRELSRL